VLIMLLLLLLLFEWLFRNFNILFIWRRMLSLFALYLHLELLCFRLTLHLPFIRNLFCLFIFWRGIPIVLKVIFRFTLLLMFLFLFIQKVLLVPIGNFLSKRLVWLDFSCNLWFLNNRYIPRCMVGMRFSNLLLLLLRYLFIKEVFCYFLSLNHLTLDRV
jgi:hypothetical protein